MNMKYLLSVAKPRSYSALIDEIRQHLDAEHVINLKVNQIDKKVLTGVSKRKLEAQSSSSFKNRRSPSNTTTRNMCRGIKDLLLYLTY